MAVLSALPALDIKQPESPIDSYSKVLGIKNQIQQGQMNQIQQQLGQTQLTSAQQQLSQTQAINSAYHDALETGDDGSVRVNQQKLTDSLAKNNHGAAIPGILKNVTDYQKSMADLQEAQGKVASATRESLGALGSAIQQSKYDPNLADMLIEQHLRQPGTPQPEIQQLQTLRQQIAANPNSLRQITDTLVSQAPKIREVAAQELTAKNRGGPQMAAYNWLTGNGQAQSGQGNVPPPDQVPPAVQTGPASPAPPPAPTGAAQIGKMNPLEAIQALSNAKPEKQDTVEQQAMNAWLAKNPGKDAADYLKWNKGITPAINFNLQNQGTTTAAGGDVTATAKRFGYNPTAFDQAAEKYWSTGQLPPAGRGGPALAANKAIMNRAADLHPSGSLAENSAEFKANQASLSKLQTQFDSVNAFEQTATKNIDRLMQTAKDIPDLGTRFLNVPARMISSDMIGTVAMAKFKADLLTAQNEAAKVLNSANASGVLSDSARHELQEMASGNLPLPAMAAAFNELKNDMGNRHDAYQQQISDIKGRMGTTSQGSNPNGGKIIKYKTVNGQLVPE